MSPRLTSELEAWIDRADRRPPDAGFALECLAWSYLLPRLATALPAAPWHAVVDVLVRCATSVWDSPAAEPLVQQLLGGELPWTLAYLFPDIARCGTLAPRAAETLDAGLRELCDDNGLPQQRWLPVLRPLLACWTRCGYLVRDSVPSWLDESAQIRLAHVVRGALRLTRPDGTASLAAAPGAAPAPDLLAAARRLVADVDNDAIAALVLRSRRRPDAGLPDEAILPAPGAHSEWAGLAVLRSGWSHATAQLVVAYGDSGLRTEFHCGGQAVWSGDWNPVLTLDGQPVPAAGPWREVCWFTDDDADYLELELCLSGGWRLQRQWLLAREDDFLYLADVLVGPHVASVAYRSCLPLAPQTAFRPASETREGCLVGRRRLARVLPLALPEWRCAPSPGQLRATAEGLELAWSGSTERLYVPLFLELDRSRLDQPFTWRQLTVGQRLQILPSSVAVGYRVQCGGQQWLFYRSLAPAASRTVLGQNIAHEFYAGRFDRDGEADQLVAVDS